MYSLVCRYHQHSGVTSARPTFVELWNKKYGNGFLLPANIDSLTQYIPAAALLSTERFIAENTIYPLLKPFLPEQRGKKLFDAMKSGTIGGNTLSITGSAWLGHLKQPFLRYCGQCLYADVAQYGEAYWHRLHQISGVLVCPVHGVPLDETDILIARTNFGLHPAKAYGNKEEPQYSAAITQTLTAIARDTEYLLNNGGNLGCLEHTDELYDKWLRVKGFRIFNGRTKTLDVVAALIDFFGQKCLTLLNAYNSGSCLWTKQLLCNHGVLKPPIYHILLMRLLAGSTEKFFRGCDLSIPEYQPFGEPPYPCRNHVCEYHLKDVIPQIKLTQSNGTSRAVFTCQYCGFTYRRKDGLAKELQYSGQIDTVEYGWLWRQQLTEMVNNKIPFYKIHKALHCDVRTAYKISFELGLIPEEVVIKREPYVPKDVDISKQLSFEEKRDNYRDRWLNHTASHPDALRNELLLLDSQCYCWLRKNDKEWYEENSPKSRKSDVRWTINDGECAKKVRTAAIQIRNTDGKPKRLSVSAISEKSGFLKLRRMIESGKLPLTKRALEEETESLEQWSKRKIVWAIQKLRKEGKTPCMKNIKKAAALTDDAAKKLADYIAAQSGL